MHSSRLAGLIVVPVVCGSDGLKIFFASRLHSISEGRRVFSSSRGAVGKKFRPRCLALNAIIVPVPAFPARDFEAMTNQLWASAVRSEAKFGSGPDLPLRPTNALSTVAMEMCSQELALDDLPNDLTRMLFLASLRDCNSGRYLHPQLTQRVGVEEADHMLSVCHQEIFRHLLNTPASGYALQLEEYIRYTRADRSVVLDTWQSLRAYRSTIPVHASALYCELFCLNVELALTIVKDSRSWAEEGP